MLLHVYRQNMVKEVFKRNKVLACFAGLACRGWLCSVHEGIALGGLIDEANLKAVGRDTKSLASPALS